MKKKYSLLIGLAICFALFVVLSWIIPTANVSSGALSTASTKPVGLFGILYYPGVTVGTFMQFGLMILAIGGFYGVLTKTGVYAKLVNDFAKRVKGKEKLFVIILAVSYMVLNSVLGAPYGLFITVPFFIGVLKKLGYEDITILAVTIGSILIGSLASTFGYNVAGTASYVLGIKTTTGVISRLVLLVLVGVLFILFLNNKGLTPKKKTKKNEEEILFITENTSKKSVTPLIIVFILTAVIACISMFNWSAVFGVTIFEKFYEDIVAISIKDYPFVRYLLDLTGPFGYWDAYELTALLIFNSLLIGWIYSLKFKDVLDGFIEGAKALVKPAIYIVLANILFTLMLENVKTGTMLTWIISKLTTLSSEINIASLLGSSVIGSFFYNHFYYYFNTLNDVFGISYGTDVNAIIMFVSQAIYGLMMLLLPTSTILVAGLSTLNVSYKEWLKYIWKLLLEIFLIITVVGIILILM